MNTQTSILLILLVFISLTSCHKDEKCYDPTNPDCENYDSCKKVIKPSALFITEQLMIDDTKILLGLKVIPF